jgi:hypothetical protein
MSSARLKRRFPAVAVSLVLLGAIPLPVLGAQPESTLIREQEQTPPTPSPAWLPRGVAELKALDKINARSATLEVKVGSSARYGSLTITVRSCVVRPPDQPQDAAAFMVIADSNANEPGFQGWMFASAPSVSMLEHPIYDVRVIGCSS